jgi:hypothetical protein
MYSLLQYPKTLVGLRRGFHLFFCVCLLLEASVYAQAGTQKALNAQSVSDIVITNKIHQDGVKRFGINLGRETFYDSGQLLRNLTFRNPGFEGEIWQSILRCKAATNTSCMEGNQYAVWPENFLKGAHFEFISGNASGLSGTIQSSLPGHYPDHGVSFNFSPLARTPGADDFVLVHFEKPGDAEKGWWPNTMNSGATFTTEFHDLSPHSPGRQALRIHASGANQVAHLDSYFDTYQGRSFVQLKGRYTLSFRAKGVGGNDVLTVRIARNGPSQGGGIHFPSQVVHLSGAWNDYSYEWTASENGSQVGPVDVSFVVSGADVLLDDVSLDAAASTTNTTAFRNEVVETLRDLKPGILRYSDPGIDASTTIDNVIAPAFARLRTGYSTQSTEQEQVPLGLHDFLELCKAVQAEPWYTLPATTNPQEMRNLLEYLGGSTETKYGGIRAKSGQSEPWTAIFPMIHLEFGNELWNAGTFYGAAISDPVSYGKRAAQLFAAARSSPGFAAAHFDLVLGSQEVNPWWTGQELANSSDYDSVAVAPYIVGTIGDTSSKEAIFGPVFSEAQRMDSEPNGSMALQAKAAREAKHPAHLAVYEVNFGADQGGAPQSVVDAVDASLGAGLSVVEHMLLMLRDLGVTNQATYALSGYANQFRNPKVPAEHCPLWGVVVDIGGPTNRRRPVFLAQQLADEALLPSMLETRITGNDPTWNQGVNKNTEGQVPRAHELQVFAFSQGKQHSLIVFNLSRQESRPITFSGNPPSGNVRISQLTSPDPADTNEENDVVRTRHTVLPNFRAKKPYSLPPVSMTTFKWTSPN